MNRTFVLMGEVDKRSLYSFLKQNADKCASTGKPLSVTVSDSARVRSLEQNKRLWGLLYTTIAEQAWVSGQQFSREVWHEFFARRYGTPQEITLPDGEVIIRRRSTTEMTVEEFDEFMNNIEVYASEELGVCFDYWDKKNKT